MGNKHAFVNKASWAGLKEDPVAFWDLFNEFGVLSHVEKVVTTYVPHAVLAERNWSSHIRNHMKSRNRFKAENVEKVSMVKHRYRNKNTLPNKNVASITIWVPTKSIWYSNGMDLKQATYLANYMKLALITEGNKPYFKR